MRSEQSFPQQDQESSFLTTFKAQESGNFCMSSYIFLHTPRLTLRHYTMDDLDRLHVLNTDEEVMKYIRPIQTDIDKTQRDLVKMLSYYGQEETVGYLAAEERETGAFIGSFALRDLDGTDKVELGYRLHKAYWGKGYATEGSQALIKYAFTEWKIPELVAVVRPEHVASQRVLEKCGFKYLRLAYYYRTHVRYYQMLAKEWTRTQALNS